jgi:hypothetical protein
MENTMAKFKLKMKLQGFELEIEGSREDVPLITQNLGSQIAGLLQPAGAIIEGEVVGENGHQPSPPIADAPARRKSRKRRSSPASPAPDQKTTEGALDWRHDSAKFGMPAQGWSTAQKAMWLLYVASEMMNEKELSSKRIATTFNKHFRQSGRILTHNVVRDLGRLKTKQKPAPVADDTTKSPAQWYLTDVGTREAQKLVKEALGRQD